MSVILVNFKWFRLFNETPVNPRKCTAVLAKILFLLNQGEVIMNGLYIGGNKKPFACQKYDRLYNIYPASPGYDVAFIKYRTHFYESQESMVIEI